MRKLIWPHEVKAALEQQRQLVGELPPEERPLGPVELIGGLDVSYSRRLGRVFAVLVVLRHGTTELVEMAHGEAKLNFPYVPGLLSYREGPACVAAWKNLKQKPDALLCDGQGKAHPRRLGLASHLGLIFEIPTVGVAKSRLIGEYKTVGEQRGERTPLVDPKTGERLGTVLRTRDNVKPLYISVGAGIILVDAEELVLANLTRYRLPEPSRLAHNYVTACRRQAEGTKYENNFRTIQGSQALRPHRRPRTTNHGQNPRGTLQHPRQGDCGLLGAGCLRRSWNRGD